MAALGLAVFALPAGSKRAALGWHSRCTADQATLAAGWRPGDNVGVGCRASGIVGVDLDRHEGGLDGCETFAALCARARAPWPSTLTVRTAHGGLHLYFRAPAGVPVPSAIARWPGIDIRGPGYRLGGYLAGPGSVVDGQPYIIERAAPIRDLPAWLAAILSRHPERVQETGRRSGAHGSIVTGTPTADQAPAGYININQWPVSHVSRSSPL